MQTLRIAGVPEHFNLPWRMAIEEGEFNEHGIELQWTDVPEGTGKLCQMLRDGSTDIAVILTEGIIKDIVAGNNSKIVQVYVETPLLWGVHVAAGSAYKTLADLKDKKVAISRFGSGSHLMAIVNAKQMGWPANDLQFEVVNTIDGAVEALTKGTADYFMWERFMTKPLVDKGIFRRLEDCPTPWPSFVIAVSNKVLAENPDGIGTVLDIINNKTRHFKEIEGIELLLAERFNQKPEDILEWLQITDWSQEKIGHEAFEKVQYQLFDIGLIETQAAFENATG